MGAIVINLFLYGPPASGKTTLGRRLATALQAEFVDLDAAIVRRAGKDIPAIFASAGEAAFRELESATLRAEVGVGASRRVIALGGGTLLRPENRAFCEQVGALFCLDAPSADELERRLRKDGATRPLGDRSKERAEHYASFPCRLAAWFDLGESLVVVGTGIAPALIRDRHCVADAQVRKLHADKLPACLGEVPSGEEHKTIATVSRLWGDFIAAGLGRKDTVVAVGGGVTGDLTGFAAATFMRGIDWINVPTTLLAMVDASTGGKTGCDLPAGKNLAGAFHSPRLVVIDTEFLKTLSPETLRQGRAEMIKHELIGGRQAHSTNLTAADIAANLAVKVALVRDDPFERTGRRLLLNCGHTVGHAVERLSDYSLSHGESVAIGCVAEAQIAVRRGLAPADWPMRLARVFAADGLPTDVPKGMSWAELTDVMKSDKKRAGSMVTFALPCGWGDVRAVEIDLAKETWA